MPKKKTPPEGTPLLDWAKEHSRPQPIDTKSTHQIDGRRGEQVFTNLAPRDMEDELPAGAHWRLPRNK